MEPKSAQLGRGIRNVGRLAQIANVFARNGFLSILETIGVLKWLSEEQRQKAQESSRDEGGATIPIRLRQCFEELGPAFVKLGQFLSLRADILPQAFVHEFAKLHQDVTQIPFETVLNVLRSELGEKRLEEFQEIVPKPLAAGSIAQVHRATLKSGEKVVVKVQRPNILQLVKSDLSLMEVFAGLIEKYVPETKSVRPRSVVAELSRGLLGELDFIREAGSTSKISKNFSDVAEVVIPKVHWGLTSEKVLTMAFLEGVSSWDVESVKRANLDPKSLVEAGFLMFLKMVFVDGYFHGDLHPGNLLAMAGNRVGVLDFGISVKISRSMREHLAALFVSLVEEDYETMCMHFTELTKPGPEFDMESFQHEVSNTIAPYVGLKLDEVPSGRLLWDLARISARHEAPMPSELVVFLRTFVALEGMGQRLDPEFDIMASCQKSAKQIVGSMYSPEQVKKEALVLARDISTLAKFAPQQIRKILQEILKGQLQIKLGGEELHGLGLVLSKASTRISVSIIVAALIVGSSLITQAPIAHEYFGLPLVGLIGFALAGFLGLYIIASIFKN